MRHFQYWARRPGLPAGPVRLPELTECGCPASIKQQAVEKAELNRNASAFAFLPGALPRNYGGDWLRVQARMSKNEKLKISTSRCRIPRPIQSLNS